MAAANSITAHVTKRQGACPGEILLQYGLASDALPHLLASAQNEPTEWRHFSNLAVAYRLLGRFEEAGKSLEDAARLNPTGWQIYHTWANVLGEVGDFESELELRRKSWEMCGRGRQEVALGLAISLLRRGEWKEAWPCWEIGRFLYSWTPPPGVKPWHGEALSGKRLLVLAEGGYGDAFDQSRWLPSVISQGSEVTLLVWERQVEILQNSPTLAGLRILPIGSNIEPHGYDFATSLLSLPALLGATPETVPPPVAFEVLPVFTKRGHPRRLGVCWKAEENGSPRRTRSIPGQRVEVLQTVEAEWFSLVPKETFPWMEPSPDNWVDTARLIKSLDCVVTVDTAVGHLAGCLGVPVILMLPLNAEWRWLTGRTDTVWYPKTRIVRATKPEEWGDVIEEAVRLLNG